MVLRQMARETGRRPSEIVGLDCDYCAWCLDEALIAREAARTRVQAQMHERTQEVATHQLRVAQMMADG